jgi:hypothetical protein
MHKYNSKFKKSSSYKIPLDCTEPFECIESYSTYSGRKSSSSKKASSSKKSSSCHKKTFNKNFSGCKKSFFNRRKSSSNKKSHGECKSYNTESDIKCGSLVRLEYNVSSNSANVRSLLPDPSFKWTKQSMTNSTSNVKMAAITTDNLGNIFITGTFNTTITLGLFVLNTMTQSPFIAKIDYDGNWIYALKPTQNNDAGTNTAAAITVDKLNNVYVCGLFQGNFQWGNLVALSSGLDIETWVVKINHNGNFIWETQTVAITSINKTKPYGIDVDSLNGLYITGTINGTAVNFGTYMLTPSGTGYDTFIAKLHSDNGTWLWANQSTQTTPLKNSNNTPSGIISDCQGNIYIIGTMTPQSYPSNMVFAMPIITTILQCISNSDAFIVKANALNGEWLVAVKSQSINTGFNMVQGNSITTDYKGNIYIVGSFIGTVEFGDIRFISQDFSIAYRNMYVSKLNSDLIWQYTLDVMANSVANHTGNDINGFGITCDAFNNVFVTGSFTGAVDFNNVTLLASSVANSIFVAKLLPEGVWNGAIQSINNSDGSAIGQGIIANYQGNVYCAGNFTGIVTFGSTNLTSIHLLNDDNTDIFVTNVVSDRDIHLTGIVNKNVVACSNVTPLFSGVVVDDLHNLIPAFDYGIGQAGNLVPFSRQNVCADPGLVYFGTACSICDMLIRR